MSETMIGADAPEEVGPGNDAPEEAFAFVAAFVNIVPKPILERFSCDSRVRRYAGPSDIFLE